MLAVRKMNDFAFGTKFRQCLAYAVILIRESRPLLSAECLGRATVLKRSRTQEAVMHLLLPTQFNLIVAGGLVRHYVYGGRQQSALREGWRCIRWYRELQNV